MSRRLAHRPRYRHLEQTVQTSLHSRQYVFNSHWTYRRQDASAFEKRPLGYSLSLLPWGARWPFLKGVLSL
jgi:hypothetical protein